MYLSLPSRSRFRPSGSFFRRDAASPVEETADPRWVRVSVGTVIMIMRVAVSVVLVLGHHSAGW